MLQHSLGGAAVTSVCPCGDDWWGRALPRWLSLTVSRDGLSLSRAADCLGSAQADLTCMSRHSPMWSNVLWCPTIRCVLRPIKEPVEMVLISASSPFQSCREGSSVRKQADAPLPQMPAFFFCGLGFIGAAVPLSTSTLSSVTRYFSSEGTCLTRLWRHGCCRKPGVF